MKCPGCGAENQNGKYCAECGAALDASCPSCGERVTPGARFCTSCGEPVAAGARPAGLASMTPWVIATAALLVVVLVLFLPRQADRVTAPPTGAADAPVPGAGDTGTGMPPLSSDMRSNADRLFNRIMGAAEEGSQAEVDQFMPMAIQAYGMVDDLDEDGLYHLGILHLTAGDPAEARRVAGRILDRSPDHILGLGLAASAAEAAGDGSDAEALWNRLLDAYPEETGKPLPEYRDHRTMLDEYRAMALEATERS